MKNYFLRTHKKLLSLLIVMVMVVGMMPVTAFAMEDGGGVTTETGGTEIVNTGGNVQGDGTEGTTEASTEASTEATTEETTEATTEATTEETTEGTTEGTTEEKREPSYVTYDLHIHFKNILQFKGISSFEIRDDNKNSDTFGEIFTVTTTDWKNNLLDGTVKIPLSGDRENYTIIMTITWPNGGGTTTLEIPGQATQNGQANFTYDGPTPAPPTGSLTINKELVGGEDDTFTFEVRKDGELVETRTITTIGGIGSATIDNLPYGTYTVTEIFANPNVAALYDVTGNGQSVTIGKNAASVTVKNELIEETPLTGSLTINKELVGEDVGTFTFEVRKDGELVETRTITTIGGIGSVTIDNLPYGTYTVTEIFADPDVEALYTITGNGQSVTIDAEDDDVSATVNNELKTETPLTDPGELTIKKVLKGEEAGTFTFKVVNQSGKVIGDDYTITITSGGIGYYTIDKLPYGTYTVTETFKDDADRALYTITGSGDSVTIDKDHEKFEVTITNELIEEKPPVTKYGSLKINKVLVDGEDGTFKFEVVNLADGALGTCEITTENGIGSIIITELAYGTYTVTEIFDNDEDLALYVIDGSGDSVTIDAEREFAITITNMLIKEKDEEDSYTGSLTINKELAGGGEDGTFKFVVTNSDNVEIETFEITTVGGIGSYTIYDLPYDTYIVKEVFEDSDVEALYTVTVSAESVTIGVESELVSVTVTNTFKGGGGGGDEPVITGGGTTTGGRTPSGNVTAVLPSSELFTVAPDATPLGTVAAPLETVDEEELPLGSVLAAEEEVEDPLVVIEEMVPLGGLPQTGVNNVLHLWVFGLLASLLATALLALLSRRMKRING